MSSVETCCFSHIINILKTPVAFIIKLSNIAIPSLSEFFVNIPDIFLALTIPFSPYISNLTFRFFKYGVLHPLI